MLAILSVVMSSETLWERSRSILHETDEEGVRKEIRHEMKRLRHTQPARAKP